jgi:hypothetical protein
MQLIIEPQLAFGELPWRNKKGAEDSVLDPFIR